MTNDKDNTSNTGWLSTLVIIAGIIGLSAVLVIWIYSTEPVAQREAATKRTAMLVEVQEVRRGDYTPRIEGLGTVEAAQDIILAPRIDGRVIGISENFVPGGFVNEGDVLVTIDPADYENAVKQMESMLQQAQSELDIELGRQDVAKREYALLDQKLSDENKALVMREPQLAAARAGVLSAQSALDQAKLELERTHITAPFDAQILSRNINVGSRVDPGDVLARLVGVDEYWITVTVPVSKLDRISFPRNGEEGAPVTITNRSAWQPGENREGRVMRLIGALDSQTRLARILVSVKDPLARNSESPGLLVGSVVQAEIEGSTMKNVFRIGRDFLREDDTLWLKRDGTLTITDATVVFKDKDYAYIADGLKDGDQLVTSNLATVAEGIELRTETEEME